MTSKDLRINKIGYFYESSDQDKLKKAEAMLYILKNIRDKSIEFIDLVDNYCVSNDVNNTKNHSVCKPDIILVLGGDGAMLKAIHNFMLLDVPFYGINIGSVGFLLNSCNLKKFVQTVACAVKTSIHPLEMIAIDIQKNQHKMLAVNEISLLRNNAQSAHIQVAINKRTRLETLVADGILISTPAGSTAYNYAAGGPIVPLEAKVLLMTPISPFRPRRWRGAVIPSSSIVKFTNLMPDKRSINAAADSIEVRDIISVEVKIKNNIKINLLFNKENCMRERIIKEQFAE